ncbi:mRNA-decapping enzyme 1A isoform X2 [Osmerus eperlanus]|uniref:mRNA-decapping enzyme 1A isoform X2 n=1 Tax=Osmerus eperlanus TaxID=29151 RepID=UPI002E16340A
METASKAGHLMSLAALQQQDPYINKLLDVTGQVALYTFNSKTNEWEKTDIEGTLFVYARSASPHHGFTIMNRLSTDNLVEPINKDLEFQLQDPFLLYRNANCIYSIWFYDKKDCQRIAQLMVTIVKQEAVQAQRTSPERAGPGRTNGCSGPRPIDIMELLSKAKEEYHRTQTGDGDMSLTTELTSALPRAAPDPTEHAHAPPQPEKSSQSGLKQITVEELFRTSQPKESILPALPTSDTALPASYLQPHGYPPPAPFQPLLRPHLTSDPGVHPRPLAPGLLPYAPLHPGPRFRGGLPGEQQPRASVSPLLVASSGAEARPAPPPSAIPSSSYLGHELLSTLKPPGSSDLHKPTLAPNFLPSPLATPQSFREPISKPAHSALSSMASPGPIQQVKEGEAFPQASLVKPLTTVPMKAGIAVPGVGPVVSGAELSVLMSPSAFQHSVAKAAERPRSGAPPTSPPSSSGGADNQPPPCNKSQLQETLIHLLKTDAAFLSTIHDAYLQSLSKDLANVQL